MQDELRQRVIAEREDERGWSIRTAAGKGAISPTAWSEFESGKRDLSKKMRAAVAQAFDWPTNWPSSPVPSVSHSARPSRSDVTLEGEASVVHSQVEWARIAAAIEALAGELDAFVAGLHAEMQSLAGEVAALKARRVAVPEPAPTTAANLQVAHRDRPADAVDRLPHEARPVRERQTPGR